MGEGEWISSKTITKADSEKSKGTEGVEKIDRSVAALSVKERPLFILMTFLTQVYTPPPGKEFILEFVVSQGMERSGQCYILKDLTNRKDSLKIPITEGEVKEF